MKIIRNIKINNPALKKEAKVEMYEEDERWWVRIVFGDDSLPLVQECSSEGEATELYRKEAKKFWKAHGWR